MGDASKYVISSYLNMLLGTFSAMTLLGLNSIIIARLLGPADYGLYSVSFSIPFFLLGFIDLGMTTAAQRFISEYVAKGELTCAKGVFMLTASYMLALSSLTTVILVVLANYIATAILGRPELSEYLRIAAFTVVLETVFRYVALNQLLALGKSHLSSFIDFLHALLRFVFAPLLILLGFGIAGALFGALIGYTVAGALGLSFLVYSFKGMRAETCVSLRDIFSYNAPFMVLGAIGLVSGEAQYVLLSRLEAASGIGNYVAAMNLTSVLTIFISPLGQISLPTFSRVTDDRQYADAVMKFSKYALVISLAAQGALLSIAYPLVHLLYGDKYILAPYLLTLSLSLSIASSFLSIYGRNSIFYIKRMYKVPIVENAINVSVFLPLTYFLLTRYGVAGIVLSSWASSLAATIYEDVQLGRLIGLNLRTAVPKLLKVEAVALASVPLPLVLEFVIPYPFNLPASLFTFIVLYGVLMVLTGALSVAEIKDIESNLENNRLGVILRPLFKLALSVSRSG